MAAEYDEDVLYLSVRELSRRIHNGTVSPVTLAQSYLTRLERIGAQLNAVVTLRADAALAEASRAQRELKAGKSRGLLHGIPYGAKDLLATRGEPTTWGAAPYRDQRFDYDATVVQRLREAGAVLVAKLAMIELAGGMGYDRADASFTGPAVTPWNTNYWAGGSSSGSGAAVAAGLVPFAIGTETSGSIVTPAAFCGVTGLRPTYGRVSRHGAMALSWSLDKIGVLSRTSDDAGIVLAAMAGPDAADETTLQTPFRHVRRMNRRPRIGVLQGWQEKSDPAVRANFEKSLAVLRAFSNVEDDVALPDYPYSDMVSVIIDAEAADLFSDLIESGRVQELTAPGSRTGAYSGMVVLAKDYLRIQRIRRKAQVDLDRALAKYDAVVSPTRSTLARPIDKPFREAYPGLTGAGASAAIGTAANLAGLPAVAVPNGFGDHNLPTSLQLTGRVEQENMLLAIASAYQARTEWHTRRPIF